MPSSIEHKARGPLTSGSGGMAQSTLREHTGGCGAFGGGGRGGGCVSGLQPPCFHVAFHQALPGSGAAGCRSSAVACAPGVRRYALTASAVPSTLPNAARAWGRVG